MVRHLLFRSVNSPYFLLILVFLRDLNLSETFYASTASFYVCYTRVTSYIKSILSHSHIEIIYPPKGRAKRTQRGPIDILSILYVIKKPKLNFQKHDRGSAFFETSKTLIPRREMRSISTRGPIVFTYVLSPEGRCEAYPVGVQLFLLMFYPPKGDAKHIQ